MNSEALPLEQELNDALYRDLWTLRNAMLADPPEGDDPDYVPPAHRYLPTLREACAKLTEAQEAARAEISKAQQYEIKIEGFRGVNPVYEVAKRAPEIRRYWLVKQMLFILGQAVEILENEGRPQPPPKPIKLGKYRTPEQRWEADHRSK